MVQRPADKPRSAIVLRGEKGAGKDIAGQYVARLMHSSAYLNTADADGVFGCFNGSIAGKLFLHLEEAFFSGDHRADSRIKNLITSPTQTINEKHAPRYTVASFHRLLITSNSFRAVNATSGERRYFISEVSDERCGERRYFDALVAEMNGDGPAALMHRLRRYDLSKWNPRPPATEALREHIAASLTGVTAWMHDCIEAGALIGGEHEIAWPVEPIEADTLRRIFEGWSRRPANRYRGIDVTESAFGKGLAPFRSGRRKAGTRDDRRYVYTLLDLDAARDELNAIITKGN